LISLKAAATAVLLVAVASPADAGNDDFLHRLIADINAKIDAAIVARPPKLVPPKKVAVHWRLAKLGSVDLGAPLVAMTGRISTAMAMASCTLSPRRRWSCSRCAARSSM